MSTDALMDRQLKRYILYFIIATVFMAVLILLKKIALTLDGKAGAILLVIVVIIFWMTRIFLSDADWYPFSFKR